MRLSAFSRKRQGDQGLGGRLPDEALRDGSTSGLPSTRVRHATRGAEVFARTVRSWRIWWISIGLEFSGRREEVGVLRQRVQSPAKELEQFDNHELSPIKVRAAISFFFTSAPPNPPQEIDGTFYCEGADIDPVNFERQFVKKRHVYLCDSLGSVEKDIVCLQRRRTWRSSSVEYANTCGMWDAGWKAWQEFLNEYGDDPLTICRDESMGQACSSDSPPRGQRDNPCRAPTWRA